MCEKCREDEEHPYEGSISNFYDRVRKIRKEMVFLRRGLQITKGRLEVRRATLDR